HPLQHPRRIGRGADGPGGAVEHGPVGGGAAAEVVALDHALEARALARPHDVDALPRLELLHLDLVADLGLVPALEAELTDAAARGQAGLVEVALPGLGDALDLAVLDQPELHRRVAVLLLRLALHDDAGPGLQDGDGDRPSVLGVDLGHADLLADDAFDCHFKIL